MRPRMLKLSILGAIGVTGLALGGCGTSLVGSASTTLVSPAARRRQPPPRLRSTVRCRWPFRGRLHHPLGGDLERRVEAHHSVGPHTHRAGGPGRVLLRRRAHTPRPDRLELYRVGAGLRRHQPGARSPGIRPGRNRHEHHRTARRHPGHLRHLREHRPRPRGGHGVPVLPVPSWQRQEAKCPKPAGEVSSQATPDVASVSDPAGVAGNLAGSGGSFPVTGVILFPQIEPAVTNGSSIDVADESCAIADAALCPTVLSDFEVREFPVPGSTAASEVPSYVTPSTRIPASRQQPVTTAPPTTLPPTPTPTVTVAPTTTPTTPPVSTPPNDQN